MHTTTMARREDSIKAGSLWAHTVVERKGWSQERRWRCAARSTGSCCAVHCHRGQGCQHACGLCARSKQRLRDSAGASHLAWPAAHACPCATWVEKQSNPATVARGPCMSPCRYAPSTFMYPSSSTPPHLSASPSASRRVSRLSDDVLSPPKSHAK